MLVLCTHVQLKNMRERESGRGREVARSGSGAHTGQVKKVSTNADTSLTALRVGATMAVQILKSVGSTVVFCGKCWDRVTCHDF